MTEIPTEKTEETPAVAKKRDLKSKSKLIKSVLKRSRVKKSDDTSSVDEEKEKREKLMAQAYETIIQSYQ